MESKSPSLNNFESQEDAKLAMAIWNNCVTLHHGMSARFEARTKPIKGSLLWKLDALTPVHPVSHFLEGMISNAVDSSRVIVDLISSTKTLPLIAHYGIYRMIIENSAMCKWVLAGKGNQRKAFNALSLQAKFAASYQMTINNLPGKNDDLNLRELIASYETSRDGLSDFRTCPVVREFKVSNLLRDVDAKFPPEESFMGVLQSWSVCSGVVHGNPLMINDLLTMRLVGEFDEYGATVYRESSLLKSFTIFHHSLMQLETAIDGYLKGCGPNTKSSR